MPVADLGAFLRRLRRVFERPEHPSPTDADILSRFAAAGDEAAFELLVWRHGPAILGLCRRLLRREQDAEDAFQATFLTLARRARSIGRRESVGCWLYKVAFRIALRLRDKTARRSFAPLDGEPEPAGQVAEGPDGDTRAALDEEVSRLPDKYRAAVVLCYLEGKTNTEAARELGCPRGTVDSRLAWARERLRRRLLRRGVCLSVTALLGSLTTAPASAAPPALVHYTAHLAFLFTTRGAALGTAAPIQLARGALRAMFFAKMKSAIIVFTTLAMLAGGSWGLLHGPGTAKIEAAPPADAEQDSPAPQSAPADNSWAETASLRCTSPLWCLAFAPDGRTLVTGSGTTGKPGELAVWDVGTARLRVRIETSGPVRGLAIAPDGKAVATAEMNDAVQLWDLTTGQAHTRFRTHAGAVRVVAFSPDGRRVACGNDNTVLVWHLGAPAGAEARFTLAEDGPVGRPGPRRRLQLRRPSARRRQRGRQRDHLGHGDWEKAVRHSRQRRYPVGRHLPGRQAPQHGERGRDCPALGCGHRKRNPPPARAPGRPGGFHAGRQSPGGLRRRWSTGRNRPVGVGHR
jgi:RNA polymerase sigma factor (sigma-70 family)